MGAWGGRGWIYRFSLTFDTFGYIGLAHRPIHTRHDRFVFAKHHLPVLKRSKIMFLMICGTIRDQPHTPKPPKRQGCTQIHHILAKITYTGYSAI